MKRARNILAVVMVALTLGVGLVSCGNANNGTTALIDPPFSH